MALCQLCDPFFAGTDFSNSLKEWFSGMWERQCAAGDDSWAFLTLSKTSLRGHLIRKCHFCLDFEGVERFGYVCGKMGW